MLQQVDDQFADMSDGKIKDELERLTGSRPRGNPARATLVSMLETALAA